MKCAHPGCTNEGITLFCAPHSASMAATHSSEFMRSWVRCRTAEQIGIGFPPPIKMNGHN